MKRIILIFAMLVIAFMATGQTIERIGFPAVVGTADRFQPEVGSPYAAAMSSAGGSLTISSEYGEASFYDEIPVEAETHLQIAEGIFIYPNPADYEINIVFDAGVNAENVRVYDVNGRLVMMREITSADSPLSLNVSTLGAGTYVLKVGNATAKMIKK